MHRSQTQKDPKAIIKIIDKKLLNIKNLKNSIPLRSDRNKILAYSAIKIKANPPAPYSILNPDTNSDSPSAKSKGDRLVSATQQITQVVTKGILTKINLTDCSILKISCICRVNFVLMIARTISAKLIS